MRTYEYLKEQIKDKRYKVWLNSEKTSFIAIWEFEEFKFIEHFASDPEVRGKGIGKEMIAQVIKESSKTVVLEAEPAETPIQIRRIAFYERAGFNVNKPYYFQPSMREGEDGLELKILSCPSVLDEREFEKVKKTLYSEVYKICNN